MTNTSVGWTLGSTVSKRVRYRQLYKARRYLDVLIDNILMKKCYQVIPHARICVDALKAWFQLCTVLRCTAAHMLGTMLCLALGGNDHSMVAFVCPRQVS